jgi:hypothetical protein
MLSLLLVMAGQISAAPTLDPPDLAAYIADVRAAGATEDAQGSLQTVAGIIAGDTILEYRKGDTGEYGTSYSSTSCPKPGLSAEELAQLRKELADRRSPIFKVLRVVADADSSGFVSSKEGWSVRRTFEFGAELSFLVEKEGRDKDRLCKLLHVTASEFDASLEHYRAMVRALAGVPVRHLPSAVALESK